MGHVSCIAMGVDAILVLIIIGLALVLFITEWLTVDLVALLVIGALVTTGVLSPEQSVLGFSHTATITVAAMFVLSAAFLKSGSVNLVGPWLSRLIRKNFMLGTLLMMIAVGVISAFINNTPVVAIFIPIVVKAASASGHSPSKLLIPLSFASIFGGTCTLVGTSTNLVVSGIANDYGLGQFNMFLITPLGIILFAVGIVYMLWVGIKWLPDRKPENLTEKFGMRDYLVEIEILPGAELDGERIMDAHLVKELDMEIIEVRRNGDKFIVPPIDFVLQAKDVLKVRCNVEKIKALKDREKISVHPQFMIGEDHLQEKDTTIVELVVTANSELEGKTLDEVEFKRKYRAVPLAIKHREEILHEDLNTYPLRAGDVLLAEIKTHRIHKFKQLETEQESPFIIVSEEGLGDFKLRPFIITSTILVGVIGLATLNILPIMTAAILGAGLLVLSRVLDMRDVYTSIDWKVIFLLAGALSLGLAIETSGLAALIAGLLKGEMGELSPYVIVSVIYMVTSLLTNVISNNAAAALLAPIAIVVAQSLGLSPIPFLVAVTFAASASFMTPIGYQTNMMVFGAGQYRFVDYLKVGTPLNLIFWILATLLIPLLFPF